VSRQLVVGSIEDELTGMFHGFEDVRPVSIGEVRDAGSRDQ